MIFFRFGILEQGCFDERDEETARVGTAGQGGCSLACWAELTQCVLELEG